MVKQAMCHIRLTRLRRVRSFLPSRPSEFLDVSGAFYVPVYSSVR